MPDKNIIDLCGKPLIVYTVEEAKKAGLFDRIIVSTDSEKYAVIAGEAGAEAVIRPAELVTDTVSTYDFIADVFQNYLTAPCEYFISLQTTHRCRQPSLLKTRVSCLKLQYVVAVKCTEVSSSDIFPIEEGAR